MAEREPSSAGSSGVKLSICMPTHNRAGFIGEALESVLRQADDRVEIVVVDGASTDNTAEVVERYRKRFKNFVYHRGEKNEGVNRDMAKTIELAKGEYCWMLSDDDALTPGALPRIFSELESGCEIYLCSVTVCNLSMQRIRERSWLFDSGSDKVFDLAKKEDFMEYCGIAASIGAFFSYMSAIILKRSEWMKTGYDRDFDSTAYALASTLFSFMGRRCKVRYINEPLVFWRNDNASFQFEGGLVKRFLLDYDGYWKLAEKYLAGDREMRAAFFKVMRREHPWYTIVHVSSYISDRSEWDHFKGALARFGYSPLMSVTCFLLSRCKGLVMACVFIKRRAVKSILLHKIKDFFKRR